MTFASELVEVKAARKVHTCEWCGTEIEKGQPYVWWNWVDDYWITVKMHPECKAAFDSTGEEEIHPHENWRGCTCERDPRCGCRNGQ